MGWKDRPECFVNAQDLGYSLQVIIAEELLGFLLVQAQRLGDIVEDFECRGKIRRQIAFRHSWRPAEVHEKSFTTRRPLCKRVRKIC